MQEQLSSDLVAHRRGISAAIEDAMRQRVEPEKVRLAHKVSHDPLLLRAVQIARGEIIDQDAGIEVEDAPSPAPRSMHVD